MYWELMLFGTLRLHDSTGRLPDVTRFRTQKGAALLAYLALHGQGRLCARDMLTEVLWPDADPVVARNRFKQELATLRRQIEPTPLAPGDVLETGGRTHIGLTLGAFTTDVTQFEKRIADAEQNGIAPGGAFELLRDATALHGTVGLLPYLYEEWLSGERERLRSLYTSGLRRLLDLHTRHGVGDSSAALSAAHQLIAADPTDEAAHTALIQLLIARDDGVQARQQLERWRKIARELGGAVSPAVEKLVVEPPQPPTPITPITPITPTSEAPTLAVPSSSSPVDEGEICPAAPLPLARTRFFGRDEKIADLLRLLNGDFTSRVITLTGPGGAGKTRLAQEVARTLNGMGQGRHPVRFRGWVPLADVTDALLLPEVLFATLFPQRQQGEGDRLGRLVDALNRTLRRASPDENAAELLILDNLEQITGDGGAGLIHDLTEQVPHLICLCTSRRPVGIEGECLIPLAPLALPPSSMTTPQEAVQVPSVALWVDRARTVSPDFQLTSRNASDVAAICRLLDGLPLALEIAAARVTSLSPAKIRHALEDDPSTLVSRRRDIAPRHRSLRDAALWSYDLLPPSLQTFWTRCSIFHGGWTLDAAHRVAADAGEGAAESLEKLEALRHHSLIVADVDDAPQGEGETRFRMLETLRGFAREQLAPDDVHQAGERHLAYFLTLTSQADKELRGKREAYWMHRLEAEHPNLRAALRFAIARAKITRPYDAADPFADAALRLSDELAQFWWLRGYVAEGMDWLREALDVSPLDPQRLARAEALRSAASLALNRDDNREAQAFASESLEMATRIGNQRSTGYARNTLGRIALNVGEYEQARDHLEQAIAIMDTFGPPKPDLIANAQAIQRENLGIALKNLGLLDAAATIYQQAMTHWRSHGLVHRYNVAQLFVLQSEIALLRGDAYTARTLVSEGLSIQREMGVRGAIVRALLHLGRIEVSMGNRSAAWEAFTEGLHAARTTGNRRGLVEAVEAISDLLTGKPDVSPADRERGARLWGWAQMMRQQFDLHVPPSEVAFWHAARTGTENTVKAAQSAVLQVEGSLLTEDVAVSLALAPVSGEA